MFTFSCPVCGNPLEKQEHRHVCASGHSFDNAKSGYVNLLLPNRMHSAAPGDNKVMVDARRSFLEKGYYLFLVQKLCEAAARQAGSFGKAPALLDAGCGEGYYTQRVYEHLVQNGFVPQMLGIDISKTALNSAAKRCGAVDFGVASVFRVPVADNSCDILLHLFAPYCGEEFQRILKPHGVLIMVIPGRDHLWELKQAVYDIPYRNEVDDTALEGFELLEQSTIREKTEVAGEDLQNLFKMTPYNYKTSKEGQERILSLESLETTFEFELFVYRR